MQRFAVELTDRADLDVERIYLWQSRRSPEAAHRWHVGFLAALDTLTSMPERCAEARESIAFPDVTVRQLLFGRYRILFHVLQPSGDNEEGVVRVLHVFHGAQS